MVIWYEDKEYKTVNVEGKEYWIVRDFAILVQRAEQTIRLLCNKGNSIRKLKFKTIAKSRLILIEEQELFEFPFTVKGRSSNQGSYIEKFYMHNEELMREETVYQNGKTSSPSNSRI